MDLGGFDPEDFRFFFAAIRHEVVDEFVHDLKDHMDVSYAYIVGLETSSDNTLQETQGQHVHVACTMTSKQYDNFRNKIFVRKHGLRGKALKGKERQYGKIKNDAIRSYPSFFAYIVKDGELRIENIPDQTIKEFALRAFAKPTTTRDLIINYLYDHREAFVDDDYVDFEDQNPKFPLGRQYKHLNMALMLKLYIEACILFKHEKRVTRFTATSTIYNWLLMYGDESGLNVAEELLSLIAHGISRHV